MAWFSKTPVPTAPQAPTDDPAVALGLELFQSAQKHRKGLFNAQRWQDKLIDWAMKDEAFKTQMFRFIDVFPALKTPDQIHALLTEYLSQPGVQAPPGLAVGLKASGLAKGAAAKTVASQIRGMAKNFILGETVEEALPRLHQFWKQGLAFSVDLLGEACVSDAEAAHHLARYLECVQRLPELTSPWNNQPLLTTDHMGSVPRVNVSVKLSALSARFNPIDPEGSIEHMLDNLAPLLTAAGEGGVLVNFDMEDHQYKEITLRLVQAACERFDFEAGLAMQAYLRSAEDDVQRMIDWAKRVGRVLTVRLIKGAYWDYETIHAEQMGWPVPVWSRKADTDACFERCVTRMVEQMPRAAGEPGIKLALGSHNLRSIAWTMAELDRLNIPRSAVEYQMLDGMGDELKAALIEAGERVRVYAPIGELIPGMAYLVRRLLENTSNESWLRGSEAKDIDPTTLLTKPVPGDPATDPGLLQTKRAAERHALSHAVEGFADGRAFNPEPMRDFSDPQQHAAFAEALHRIPTPDLLMTTPDSALEQAIGSAVSAQTAWSQTPVTQRAEMLVQTAALMREQRDALSGLIVREAGKPWAEADADVCEAIDFLDYYAREAVAMFEPKRLGAYVGELDTIRYTPVGVTAVISPWNFPLAICAGMTAAALVTGNPTLVKPAEQTPRIAKLMCDLLWQAGVPREVLHFVPGPGETTGDTLVRDERINLVAFTGSQPVGREILRISGDLGPTRRVICEMGGKNAAIVDDSADLDEAVLGVRQSAFGFAGQKCSACSRVIVVGPAYDRFLERFVESCKALRVGDPLNPGSDYGPVIDKDAANKTRQYIQIGQDEATLAYAGVPDPQMQADPRYIGPHVFKDVSHNMRLAQEEIFGPVIAVMKAETFDEALAIANGTAFKLTGGVFSRTPHHLEQAKREYRVGNLYLNRSITGALVGRQPFGGFGQSGTGTKAGGADYLKHFVYPIAICENTMRRGFAPGLD